MYVLYPGYCFYFRLTIHNRFPQFSLLRRFSEKHYHVFWLRPPIPFSTPIPTIYILILDCRRFFFLRLVLKWHNNIIYYNHYWLFTGQSVEAQFQHSTATHVHGPPVLRSDRERPSLRGRTLRRYRFPDVRIVEADHREDSAVLG